MHPCAPAPRTSASLGRADRPGQQQGASRPGRRRAEAALATHIPSAPQSRAGRPGAAQQALASGLREALLAAGWCRVAHLPALQGRWAEGARPTPLSLPSPGPAAQATSPSTEGALSSWKPGTGRQPGRGRAGPGGSDLGPRVCGLGTTVPQRVEDAEGPFSRRHLLGRTLLRMETCPSPLSLALRRAEGRGRRLRPCAPPRPRAPRGQPGGASTLMRTASATPVPRPCQLCGDGASCQRRPGSDSPGQEGGRGLSPRSAAAVSLPLTIPRDAAAPPPSAHGVPSGHRGHTV